MKGLELSIQGRAVLAAAVMIGTASLATALAMPAMASITGFGSGVGSTADQARFAATIQLNDDYFGCKNIVLISDVQQSDGSWDAEVTATCQGVR
jgi:hypothetical protein